MLCASKASWLKILIKTFLETVDTENCGDARKVTQALHNLKYVVHKIIL